MCSNPGHTCATFCSACMRMTCVWRRCCLTDGLRHTRRQSSITDWKSPETKRPALAAAEPIVAPAANSSSVANLPPQPHGQSGRFPDAWRPEAYSQRQRPGVHRSGKRGHLTRCPQTGTLRRHFDDGGGVRHYGLRAVGRCDPSRLRIGFRTIQIVPACFAIVTTLSRFRRLTCSTTVVTSWKYRTKTW
jgi:hypothetical protein